MNTANTPTDQLMNAKQVAILLGLKVPTLKAMRRKRQGPKFIRIGRQVVRYNRADVDQYLADHTVTTEALE